MKKRKSKTVEAPLCEFASTTDDWQLPIYHYPHQKKKFPVVLIHGLGTNRYSVDCPAQSPSLAKFLHQRGYDVWFVELRGVGQSRPGKKWLHRWNSFKGSWDIDDYIYRDMPAIVRHIQEKTGKKKFHWVGHSLGGVLVYTSIETLGNSIAASAVTLGSAMSAHEKNPFVRFLLGLPWLYRCIPYLPTKYMARFAHPFRRWLLPLRNNPYAAKGNFHRPTFEEGMRIGVENVSTTLFLQMYDWYSNNHFRSRDKTFSFHKHLKRIKVPVLLGAGSADTMTPYRDVRHCFDRLGSRQKELILFGKKEGGRSDYAHSDLLLGKYAPTEVFPRVAEWFDRFDR